MKFIIDTNIIFSILIKSAVNQEIFLCKDYEFYAPDYLISEIEKHKVEILNKTLRTSEEFEKFLELLMRNIKIINKCYYLGFIEDAERISPDFFDAPYFALALKLECPIWSNDKKLKQQKRIEIFSTEEMFQSFKKL